MAGEVPRRRVVRVTGLVQGVGFRPYVARLARKLALAGEVSNDGTSVRIDVEGPAAALEAFTRRLGEDAPEAARIDKVRWEDATPSGRTAFVIAASTGAPAAALPIPPDLRTCPRCRDEVGDPAGRRHRYPFTSCTECGPRFTFVEALPYDRPQTTMRRFPLCEACRREYLDPADRRHHAQSLACPRCGPHLRALDPTGEQIAARDAALAAAAEALRRGGIVALKGLGGYQLLCDARDVAAVERLRRRKRREAKPFAVMVSTLAMAQELACLSPEEAAALSGPDGPIVLVRRHAGAGLADAVAPRIQKVGLLLPTTPLHHLLLDALRFPLVCTSGNVHEEPIAIDDADALERLSPIADLFLVHDRPIARRADDGVVHVVAGRARVLRLGRGLGPRSVRLARSDGIARLCLGGHLKNAPAAALGDSVVLWPHVGDLDTPLARDAFAAAVADLQRFLSFEPAELVCDLHPDYASSLWAEEHGLPVRRIPHHLTHVAACLAEHGEERALGFAWDGFGLGPGGDLWGGETLRVDGGRVARVAHLHPFPLPGGDAAARDGRRALAGLFTAAGWTGRVEDEVARFLPLARSPALAPRTTSAGRLFDAVAALLGVCTRSSFEGQAAMELEALAEPGHPPYPFRLDGDVIDWTPMLAPLAGDRGDAVRASSRFHATLIAGITAVAAHSGAERVALSGGCFQNAHLAEQAWQALSERGIDVLLPCRAPPNDGGLALGQAWAASRGREGVVTR